jgi:hypothetical protein
MLREIKLYVHVGVSYHCLLSLNRARKSASRRSETGTHDVGTTEYESNSTLVHLHTLHHVGIYQENKTKISTQEQDQEIHKVSDNFRGTNKTKSYYPHICAKASEWGRMARLSH